MLVVRILVALCALVTVNSQVHHAGLRGEPLDGSRELGFFSGSGSMLERIRNGRMESGFVNSTCVNPESAPVCALPSSRRWENSTVEGVWVCRNHTRREMMPETTCIRLTRGHESDTCGCCNGVCPTVCECPCQTNGGEEGVLVEFTRMRFRSNVTKTKCIPVDLSPSITSRSRRAQCVVTCPAA